MNIILLLELGYYQMNTIFGIPMHQINPKKIHVLIFLNQIMVRWDMGNFSFLVLQLFKYFFNRIQIFCDYERIQPMDNYIIQEYIREPYLIDGYKFGKIYLFIFLLFFIF